MLDRAVKFPDGWLPGTPTVRPLGIAKNATTIEAEDGAPWDKDYINDIDAVFQGAVLRRNITISGVPDTGAVSDVLDAFGLMFGITHATISDAIADTTLKAGMKVSTQNNNSTERGGAADYLVMLKVDSDALGITDYTFGNHISVLPTLALILQRSYLTNIRQYGALDGQDNVLNIQAAVDANSVLSLGNVKGLLSDEIDISKSIIMYGDGLNDSVHERDFSVNTGINPFGINISNAAAKNSIFRDFQIKFTGITSALSTAIYIGLNNTKAANVLTERCRFDGGNVGIHYKQVSGGLISNNQIANMVIADNGVTGYGINTDGSDGTVTFKNSIVQCERHAIYVPSSNVGLFKAKNQRHLYNDMRWTGAVSPASQQACVKVFSAENIVITGNTGIGLKKALWMTESVDGLVSTGNTWDGMTVRGVDDENRPSLAVLKNIRIADTFKNITGEAIFGTGGLDDDILWEDLNANDSTFENCTIGLQPTKIRWWTYDGAKFKNNTTAISTVAGTTAPPVGRNDATFDGNTTDLSNFPSGGNSNLTGSTTPDVSDNYDDYHVVNTGSTTITDFVGGHHGQEFTLLFIQSIANTTIANGTIFTRSGANVTPGSNQIMKFKNIRGSWREI